MDEKNLKRFPDREEEEDRNSEIPSCEHSASSSQTITEKICRYCFESGISSQSQEDDNTEDENPLISPCQCSGTQKYVHKKCLQSWQIMILTNSLHNTNENRHLLCSTCGGEYQGIIPPSRLSLIEAKCYPIYLRSLANGCFLVTSLVKSQRTLPNSTNIPPILAALFELKSSHWRYGVYWIYHFEKEDDGMGNEPILALNLTRVQNGSRDEPIPDEVLNEIERCRTSERNVIKIRHHNGGPVHWSSVRTGTCVLHIPRSQIYTIYNTLFPAQSEDDSTSPPISNSLYDCMNPIASPQEQFKIWTISPEVSLVIGKFCDVMKLVRYISEDALGLQVDEREYLVNSYSGYAKWNRAQLIHELSDPNGWGLVTPDTSLSVCGEYLETGQYSFEGAPTIEEGTQSIENSTTSDPMSRLRIFADATRHQLWNNVRRFVISRDPEA